MAINEDYAYKRLSCRYLNAVASDGGHGGCMCWSRLSGLRVCALRSSFICRITLAVLSDIGRILIGLWVVSG